MTTQPSRGASSVRAPSDRALRVVISNGVKNFHLSSAAAEVDARGDLLALFNGIYPKKGVRKLIQMLGLHRWSRARRMLARAVHIDESKVQIFWLADVVNDFAIYMTRYSRFQNVIQILNRGSMEVFAHHARTLMARKFPDCEVYHYRAGFGLQSVEDSKRKNILALCDHSIVHPLLLDAMIQNGGRFPDDPKSHKPSGIWNLVLKDIEAADHVLVNSDFVKSTFVHAGFDPNRVSVIYLGVDDAFLESVPPRASKSPGEPLRFLFAGSFNKRKGADTLMQAIAELPDQGWTLEIAGPVETNLQPALQKLLERPQVRHLGNLSRADLANAMSRADVFVFPSLAEGSARVVFEALACGCFIITTLNTGSIVEEGVHGRIIPPGDLAALRRALADAIQNPGEIPEAGSRNAALIRSNYTQHAYGDALRALYNRLLDERATMRASSFTGAQ